MTGGTGRRRTDGWGPDSDDDLEAALTPEDDLDAGLTPEELAAERAAAREALRRLHVPVGGVCDWCGRPFPCPDSQN